MRIKEAFGVNTMISLKNKEKQEVAKSNKVGSTTTIFAKLNKGESYLVELLYQNSIIEFSDFFSCPHLNVELSMIPEKEALKMA